MTSSAATPPGSSVRDIAVSLGPGHARPAGIVVGRYRASGLWYLDDLVACASKVLARSGNGDLVFVGRSLARMYDRQCRVMAA
jgi:hypothetical protein